MKAVEKISENRWKTYTIDLRKLLKLPKSEIIEDTILDDGGDTVRVNTNTDIEV